MRNLIAFIFLSFLIITSVSAKNIKREQISPQLESIQVLALKEKKEIFTKNSSFFTYDTFVDTGNDFQRYYIVNLKAEDFEKVLSVVKKRYPSAFKASKKIATLKKYSKNLPNKRYKIYKSAYHDSLSLNSKTILNTRRKFF